MRVITGCFRNTAIAAMEHETALLSPQWHLTDKILQTAIRMITTATDHPIHKWIARARLGAPPYPSNLENFLKQYPNYMRPGMELIEVYTRPPWWKLEVITVISRANKDEAAKAHRQRLHHIPALDLIIYTDGSGQNGQIGAPFSRRQLTSPRPYTWAKRIPITSMQLN